MEHQCSKIIVSNTDSNDVDPAKQSKYQTSYMVNYITKEVYHTDALKEKLKNNK